MGSLGVVPRARCRDGASLRPACMIHALSVQISKTACTGRDSLRLVHSFYLVERQCYAILCVQRHAIVPLSSSRLPLCRASLGFDCGTLTECPLYPS